MSRSIVLALLAALGSTGSLDHCYGIQHRLTVMEDGSGKIDLVISDKPAFQGDLKKPFPLLELSECTTGVAAFSAAKTEVKGEWRTTSLTAYFEDINKVHYKPASSTVKCDARHDECLHFTFARSGEGFVLTMEDWLFGRSSGMRDASDKEWEKIRADSVNVLQWTVTLPGKVTKVEGFQRMEGPEAFYERSPKTISKPEDALKWPLAAKRTIECDKPDRQDAKLAAFKAEMQRAKMAWPKLKAELEAARAKK